MGRTDPFVALNRPRPHCRAEAIHDREMITLAKRLHGVVTVSTVVPDRPDHALGAGFKVIDQFALQL